MPSIRIPPNIQELIIEYWNSGSSINDIAESFQYKSLEIVKVLKGAGVKLGSINRPTILDEFSSEALEAMVNEYSNGMEPVSTIYARYEISLDTLYRILNTLGVPRRTANIEALDAKKMQMEAAIEAYQKGVALWKIELDTGIQRDKLRREMYKRGIPLRTMRESVGEHTYNHHPRKPRTPD